jgi:hypothetical protein
LRSPSIFLCLFDWTLNSEILFVFLLPGVHLKYLLFMCCCSVHVLVLFLPMCSFFVFSARLVVLAFPNLAYSSLHSQFAGQISSHYGGEGSCCSLLKGQ